MWDEHILNIPHGQLFWCEQGAGTPVIFLHGGPGDEHRYLKPLAQPFASHFHCVLFDQRGSGASKLERLDDTTLNPRRFADDLECIRIKLGMEKLILVGHSWGALLALLYGTMFPERVSRIALIGLGPLTVEMETVAKANRLKCLSPVERTEYAHMSIERENAIQAGDQAQVTAINRRRALLGFRGTFYKQDSLEQFVAQWLEAEPYRNWQVNQAVNRLWDRRTLWENLPRLRAPTLALYGYQDFEPITQAFLLKERMPNVRVHFINECGHNPWLEQPQATYQALFEFISTANSTTDAI